MSTGLALRASANHLLTDPGLAPGSKFSSDHRQSKVLSVIVAGTPEAGGWTSREVKRIIRGLAGLNFVFVSHKALVFHNLTRCFSSGADVVEVAPAYDHGGDARHSTLMITDEGCIAEITAIVAADIVHDFLSMFMSYEPPKFVNLPGQPRDEL